MGRVFGPLMKGIHTVKARIIRPVIREEACLRFVPPHVGGEILGIGVPWSICSKTRCIFYLDGEYIVSNQHAFRQDFQK